MSSTVEPAANCDDDLENLWLMVPHNEAESRRSTRLALSDTSFFRVTFQNGPVGFNPAKRFSAAFIDTD